MVIRVLCIVQRRSGLLLAHTARLPEGMDPVTPAKAVAALVLLSIGGIALVVLSWLFLRVGRRSLRRDDARQPRRHDEALHEDWAKQRLTGDLDRRIHDDK